MKYYLETDPNLNHGDEDGFPVIWRKTSRYKTEFYDNYETASGKMISEWISHDKMGRLYAYLTEPNYDETEFKEINKDEVFLELV